VNWDIVAGSHGGVFIQVKGIDRNRWPRAVFVSTGMKRPVQIALMVMVGMGTLAFAFWPGEDDPKYEGKRLSEWLAPASTTNPSEEERKEAYGRNGRGGARDWNKWLAGIFQRM
jgi:hypothetical protein